MHEPSDEVIRASALLDRSGTAFVSGDRVLAAQLLREADKPPLLTYYERCTNNRGRPAPVAVRDPLPRDQRIETRMPTQAARADLYQRDGWRCRFCGVRVVDPRARKHLTKELPEAARWGQGNAKCHSAMLVLLASPDHVVPHSHGGDNSMKNMVTACFVCQFARGAWLLDEAGISDPRDRPPVVDEWDGLLRVC
jgi:5-methylcytosine-specific restriction endonuclease McrA